MKYEESKLNTFTFWESNYENAWDNEESETVRYAMLVFGHLHILQMHVCSENIH